MAETTGPNHTPTTEKPRGRRKTAIGYVVSDKMEKTIVVELESRKSHPLYGKIIRTTSKVKAHDENGDAGIGDRDPSDLGDQALASGRDPREGKVEHSFGTASQTPGTACAGRGFVRCGPEDLFGRVGLK
jgi:small subunit ribosomal protein S17